jgi:peptidoglycan hydrolase-like protein with peptidoglycan-binding domain
VNPEAAAADWDVNRAYWALFADDREETTFNREVIQRCALPTLETPQEQAGRIFVQEFARRIGSPLPIVGPQPLTDQHVRCVINAFRNRATALRTRLRGDALVESNWTPDEHIDIQVSLDRKGFMRNRDKRYGVAPDGQFGPNTRAAIKEFQRSINAEPTGFLSNEQRIALVENPEERAAREARQAAAEKARQDAIEAKKLADLNAKQDEDAKELKRLEEEVARATARRQKIEEAKKKGEEYAKREASLSWSLSERDNPMTDEKEYTVSSIQLENSVAASVEGKCQKNKVYFEATILDAKDPNTPLGIPGHRSGGIVGNKRINDETAFPATFPTSGFRNRIVMTQLSFENESTESADTTWRILGEIETANGTIIVRVPTFDPKIQKLIAACKKQYEIENRRHGLRDVPG